MLIKNSVFFLFLIGPISGKHTIGIDKTKEWEAEKVGSTVEWFDKFGEFNFSKSDYLKMLGTFEQRLPIDKLRIEEHIKEWNDKKTNR
ncbi:hypothetical protein [Pedobacter sp. SL55]|uniref:hypothetical protein n=1 Tax=Pedobacter sp. SL55 TaxID=2995161 RepID=UPI00226EE484|nr:hypothetical protein [Pedobacter sp. SL55]WAC39835.1 hypothetical protein OVA16_14785 [Pedobacter sp. SL55]